MDGVYRPRLAGQTSTPVHFDRSILVPYESAKTEPQSKDNNEVRK